MVQGLRFCASNVGVMGSILGRGSKIPHAMLLSQKKKKKNTHTHTQKQNKNPEKEHKCHSFEIA